MVCRAALLALCLALLAAPALAQPAPDAEGSELGKLLLTLQTSDGQPIVGAPVIVKRADASVGAVVAVTDEAGSASVPIEAFPTYGGVRALIDAEVYGEGIPRSGLQAAYGAENDEAVRAHIAATWRAFDEAVPSDLPAADRYGDRSPFPVVPDTWEAILPGEPGYHPAFESDLPSDPMQALRDAAWVSRRLRAVTTGWDVGGARVVLTDDPSMGCGPGGYERTDGGAAGCGATEPFGWGDGSRLDVRLDTGCDLATENRSQAEVSGGSLFPMGEPGEAPTQPPGRDVDVFRPLPLHFPDNLGRTGAPPPLSCLPENDLPGTSLLALHGYNVDFEDGSLGLRAFFDAPVLEDQPLGIAASLDYYPQDDVRSTLTIGADLTYHLSWASLKDGASAYAGLGPRAYVQSTESTAGSSTTTEVGGGAVSGMIVPIGPVQLYGDVGVDRVYGAFVPVTRFGVGIGIGD